MAAGGLDIEGAGFAIASLGPLFCFLDARLNPGFLVGPAIYIYVVHLFGYVLGPVGQRYLHTWENFSSEGMVLAQWGAVLGMLTFVPFYYAAFRFVERRARPARQDELTPNDPRWSGFTIALGVTALIIAVYTHFSGAARRLGDFDVPDIEVLTLASAFSLVPKIVFLFLAFVAAKRRTPLAIGSWVTALLSYSAYGFLEGTRGTAFVALLLSAVGFVLGGIRRKLVIAGLIGAFAILIPVSSIVVLYRGTPEYSSRYDEGLVARTEAFSSAASNLAMQSTAGENSSLGIFLQTLTANTVDRIMEFTPERVPFAMFRDLENVIYVWMPRVIMPDRPSIYEGNDIAMEYGVGHDGVRSWTYTPTVGEGYRRFGWFGIPVVYAFVACIYGAANGLCWARRRQREWAALLAVCLLDAPNSWASTILACINHLLWSLPKYFIFFLGLRYSQDIFASLLGKTLRQRKAQGFSPPEAPLPSSLQ